MMNYIEKHPQPRCCRECPEVSAEICFHCEHFRERFEVLDSELAEEQLRRNLLRKLLRVKEDDEYFVIRWKPVEHRPVNHTYVLIKEKFEDTGVLCSLGSYEKNRFWYFFDAESSAPADEKQILGWDYLPYDEHPNEREEELFDSFLRKMGRAIREELIKQSELESDDETLREK